MRRDVHNGQSGEWRGGMWFPDLTPPAPPTHVTGHVCNCRREESSHDSVERISEEMEMIFLEHNQQRRHLIEENRREMLWCVAGAVVFFIVTTFIIHLLGVF